MYQSLSPLGRSTLKLLIVLIAVMIAADVLVYFGLRYANSAGMQSFEEALSVIQGYVNTDTERSIPAWFSGGLWFLSSAVGLVIARANSSKAWVVFAIICAGLSLDEIIGLHEGLGDQAQSLIGNQGGLLNFEWVVIGAALAVLLVAAGYRAVRTLDKELQRIIFISGVVFVSGALVFESISGFAIDNYGLQVFYHSMAWIEEALEMIGVSLLLVTLITESRI